MATAPETTQRQTGEQSNEQEGGRNQRSPEDDHPWKKYGQKFIKSIQKNRSYFKCKRERCKARKKVEWPPSNPNDQTVAYEDDHNHPSGPQSSQQSPTVNDYNLLSQVLGPTNNPS